MLSSPSPGKDPGPGTEARDDRANSRDLQRDYDKLQNNQAKLGDRITSLADQLHFANDKSDSQFKQLCEMITGSKANTTSPHDSCEQREPPPEDYIRSERPSQPGSDAQNKQVREERADYLKRKGDLVTRIVGRFSDRNSMVHEGGIKALVKDFRDACQRVPIHQEEMSEVFEDLLEEEALETAKNFRRFEFKEKGYVPFPVLEMIMVTRLASRYTWHGGLVPEW
jgi:hypothetical protein